MKLAQPFPAPELRTRILRTRGFFWSKPLAHGHAYKRHLNEHLPTHFVLQWQLCLYSHDITWWNEATRTRNPSPLARRAEEESATDDEEDLGGGDVCMLKTDHSTQAGDSPSREEESSSWNPGPLLSPDYGLFFPSGMEPMNRCNDYARIKSPLASRCTVTAMSVGSFVLPGHKYAILHCLCPIVSSGGLCSGSGFPTLPTPNLDVLQVGSQLGARYVHSTPAKLKKHVWDKSIESKNRYLPHAQGNTAPDKHQGQRWLGSLLRPGPTRRLPHHHPESSPDHHRQHQRIKSRFGNTSVSSREVTNASFINQQ